MLVYLIMVVPIFSEVLSSSLSTLLAHSMWDFVAKRAKWVPLPDFFLSASPFSLRVLQGG